MKKIILFLLVSLFYWLNPYQRNLILLPEWHNETLDGSLNNYSYDPQNPGFGAISSAFTTALLQKSGIVLASVNLWRNFYGRKQLIKDFINKDMNFLLRKYGKYNRFNSKKKIEQFQENYQKYLTSSRTMREEIKREIVNYYLPYNMPFNINEWDVRKVSRHFYLFIPKTYIAHAKKQTPEIVAKFSTQINFDEVVLNCKFERFPKATDLFTFDRFSVPITNIESDFIKLLPNIFVTLKDVANPEGNKDKTDRNILKYLQEWDIYLNGHGGNNIISGLSLENFQKTLQFFNDKVKTRFLFYETCYAGGKHLRIPFEEKVIFPPLKKANKEFMRVATIKKQFNYIISTGTLTYEKTSTFTPSFSIPFNINYLRFNVNLQKYFDLLQFYFKGFILQKTYEKLTPKMKENFKKVAHGYIPRITLADVIEAVHPYKIAGKGFQIPVIRFPNTQWFYIPDLRKKVKRLTQTEVEVKEAQNESIIVKDKEVLILDFERPRARRRTLMKSVHTEIMTTIEFENNMPTIIPTNFIDAEIYIEDVISPVSFPKLCENFFTFKEGSVGIIYYIPVIDFENTWSGAQLTNVGRITETVLVNNRRLPIKNAPRDRRNAIIFRFNNKYYMSEWDSTDQNARERLKKGQFPNLKEFEETIYPGEYFYDPRKLEEKEKRISGIRKIIEVQKKGPKKPRKKPKEKKEVSQMDSLEQALKNLELQLRGLRLKLEF